MGNMARVLNKEQYQALLDAAHYAMDGASGSRSPAAAPSGIRGVLAKLEAEENAQEPAPLARTLASILVDPAAVRPPSVVVPRLAWSGRVSLLAAREKAGKSTLATAAAAAVTQGGLWLGEPAGSGRVLWLGLEEHLADLASRCVAWGTDPERFLIVDSLLTAGDPLVVLRTMVEDIRPALLVVDTLAALVMSLNPDPGSSSAWVPIMGALARIARETDTAVILLHHARKSDGQYRDSSAIGAGVDVILEMSEDGQDAAARRVRVKARWQVADYSVRLTDGPDRGGRYELASGEVSLDARVLLYVQEHPGATRAVRTGVSGKATAVDAAVVRLLKRAALEDRGGPTGRSLYVVGLALGHMGAFAETPRGHATDTPAGPERVPSYEPLSGASGRADPKEGDEVWGDTAGGPHVTLGGGGS